MKQQQLLFDKGITYVPSDVLCSDNALSECVGMTYENGEMKPIQNPKASGSVPASGELLFVHRLPSRENRIYLYDGKLYVDSLNGGVQYTGYPKQIASVSGTVYGMKGIGKTLILSTSSSLFYYLWNGDGYTSLGSRIPDPELKFLLTPAQVDASCSADLPDDIVEISTRKVAYGKIEDYKNIVVGLYSKCKSIVDDKKGFYAPFMVRYAVELYDGTLTLQSNPIVLFPGVSKNLEAYHDHPDRQRLVMKLWVSQLMYLGNTDFSKWTDIVKNVSIFVTRQSDIYDTAEENFSGSFGSSEKLTIKQLAEGATLLERIIANDPTVETRTGSFNGERDNKDYMLMTTGITDTKVQRVFVAEGNTNHWDIFKARDIMDVLDDLKEDGVFYKLCDVGLEPTGQYTYRNLSTVFKKSVLKTLETQDRMVQEGRSEDYYSRSTLEAKFMDTYNMRLHLANINRGIFDGFTHFSSNGGLSLVRYETYVKIKTDDGERVAYKDLGQCYEKIGHYFYYPDPRAYEAVIVRDRTDYITLPLTEHPALNGAYFITAPLATLTYTTGTPSGLVANMTSEYLPNVLAVSDVNNPFVFNAEGYNTVGMGEIHGMAAQTVALSQGQFGQYPLLVFATDGIWAMSVGNTGVYQTVRPMSREVCSVPSSITQTDNAVYFVSEKGLMVVGNSVKCVSEQMDGKSFDVSSPFSFVLDSDFKSFISNCKIAYDYRDSQLVIINPNKGFQWVYNMKSGTFSKAQMLANSELVKTVVNDYPDSLIQAASSGNIYSLLQKPDQNHDGVSVTDNGVTTYTPTYYSGTILTRPMKLENGLALKTIMDLENIRFFHQDTYTETEGQTTVTKNCLVLKIYGSNNCKNWLEVPSLTGVPWKYYRFKFEFNKLKASDRFAGTVLVTQERRTNQLR